MRIGPSTLSSYKTFISRRLPIATAIGLALAVPNVSGAESGRQIEEVIVTAERQEASIQDTSISITAFTSEMLDSFGIRNQEDLQNFIPATTIQPYDATVRGVGRNFRALGGDPGVATYMNGVYSEDLLTATAATFWDVERIEVLRGPQGTLYGRNAIGGAVNILYKEPSEEFDYAFKAIAGNFSTKELYGMVNGALWEDKLSARFNFSLRDRDGVIKEIGPGGKDLDGLGTENYAIQFHFTPTDSLTFNVRANQMKIDRIFGGANGGGLVVLNEEGGATRNTTDLVPGYRRIDTNNTDPANRDQSSWYDTSRPILTFTDPSTGEIVQAQHNRPGIDLAEFSGFQNAAASLDGFNFTSAESAARYNACVFPKKIKGDDICAATNGLNREAFNQQGVQFSADWDVSESLQLKYILGFNKLSYQRTTDDDNTGSLIHDRQFYVNHEARYSSNEFQAFFDVTENLSFTSGIFFYQATIDQRGDFYSSVGERRFIEPYQDNTGIAGLIFGGGPIATLHSAKARCQDNPQPSCERNYAVENPALPNNNLHITPWLGDDGTNPDLNVQHGIISQGSDLLYHTQTKRDAFAAYTQGVWDINDEFTLTFGLRYGKDTINAEENLFRYSEVAGGLFVAGVFGINLATYNRINGGLVPDPTAPFGERVTDRVVNGGIPVALSVYRPFHRSDDKYTWRLNLDWNFSDNSMVYFGITTGTRSGGYNLVFFSATPTYKPEDLTSYEFGYKTQLLNDTLQINGSFYYYDYQTIHTVATEVSTIIPGSVNTTTSVLPAPGAEIYGAEAEVLWLATDNWTIGGNFSYTPSEYTKDLFIKDPGAIDTPESLFPTFEGQVKNIKGNDLLQVPEWKYTAYATYRIPLAGGSNIDISGVYSWIDKVYYSPFQNDAESADSYGRTDLRATWTSASGNWVASAYVNNIFDDVGVLQVLREGEDEFFRHSAGTTVPRTYGVELTYTMGH